MNKKIRNMAVAGVAVVAVAGLLATRLLNREPFAEGVADPIVEITQPELRDIKISTGLVGEIEPEDVVYVYPKAAGEVTEVSVKAGEMVQQGQQLCVIDTKQIENAKSSLDSAELNLKQAKDELARQEILYSGGGISQQAYEQYQKIENTRQSLIVMCGWSAGSQPHIDTVPEWSREEIDAADPDSDLQQALENNYTLRINKRKLENTLDADNKAQLERTISGNERQIEISIQNAWQNLQTAERSYDQAVSAKLLEEENYTLAGQKKDAGMITEYEYESAGLTLQMKESAVRIASLELIEALESYRWKVNGLASAE